MIPFDRTLIAAVVIAVTTTACGGGGGGGSSTAAATPPPASGGTGGDTGSTGGDTGSDTDGDNGDTDNGDPVVNAKDVAFGTITQFGSIFVNGVKYDTSTAKIIIDGVERTEDDLGVGMVVFVQGTVNEDGVTGVAEVVIVDDNLKGPISEVTPATDDAGNPRDARQITVLGIEVIIERTGTVFEGTTFETITAGEFVEIYGFNEAGNNVRATRVQARAFVADTTEIEVYGTAIAGSIDAGAKTFTLGEYTVDYSAADVTDLIGGDPAEGVLLEVKGTLASPDALFINANKVEPANFDTGGAADVPADPTSAATEQMSVEGVIGNYDAEADTFTINGFTVDASGATVKPADAVANGAVVQVKGSYDGEILKATVIESRRGQIEVEGSVSGIDGDNNTVTIGLGGDRSVMITVDNRTLFDDDTSDKNRRFGFEDVRTGDYLGVEAVNLGEGTYMATRIDREDDDEDEVEIQAPVESFEPSISVTVLGMTFMVDGRTEYELVNGNEVSAEAFFGALELGALLKVEDEDLDGVADEIEFETEGKLAGSEFVDSDDDSDDDSSDDDSSDDDSSDDDSSDDDSSDDNSSDDDSSDDDSSDDDSSDDDSSDDDSSDDDSSDDDDEDD